MKKRIVQIFAVIFAVGILASCLIVPAAAADRFSEVTYYDGMVKNVIDFDGSMTGDYVLKSNLANYYTVKTGENAIAFENNGKQGAWAYWQTPYLDAEGCVLFAQEYAVFDNNIPQITYQFMPEDGEKIQVARFTTGGKLYYRPEWIASGRENETSIVTFQPSDNEQICAFRDEFLFDPYTETLMIRRWYWTNGNHSEPAYKFEIITDNDLCFKRSSGYYGPENFKIRGYIQHTSDYFQDNVVQIQMTRQVARTWRLSPTRDEIISLRMDWADLELENKTLRGQVASLEEGIYQLLMNREDDLERYEADLDRYKRQIQALDETRLQNLETIKALRESVQNYDALSILTDGVFNGINSFFTPIFEFSFWNISIGACLVLIVIVVMVRFIIGFVRGK